MFAVYTLLSTLGISLLSLVGVFSLSVRPQLLNRLILVLVSLSAGTMMGTVFLHLLPEAHSVLGSEDVYRGVLISFIVFFLIEKLLHWQHCHKDDYHIHSFGYLNLVGDGLHNFIDGMLVAGAYATDIRLGLVTTLAVGLHELPQEIGDFGVLVHAGLSTTKALLYNLLSAVTAVGGAIVGILLIGRSEAMGAALLPVAAGGFLYIAASDLLPEIRKQAVNQRLFVNFAAFLAGIGLILILPDIN